MEHYLTVTIDRHGRGRTSASSSVLSTLSQPRDDNEDDDVVCLPISRSRHSVDCSGMMTSSTPRPSSPTSRSTSRLHLGVPSDLRRSSLQTDHHHQHHHHHQRHSCPHRRRREEFACDGAGCAHSSGSRSSVALTDDEATSARRVSYGGAAPLRSVAAVSAARETTIFDIGADLIKVSIRLFICAPLALHGVAITTTHMSTDFRNFWQAYTL